MNLGFRWYGEKDSISLQYISQIPAMHSIVTAVYDVSPGKLWPLETLQQMKEQCEQNGLIFDVVESIPVHEDIKLGKATRDEYIRIYCENIRRVASVGVKCICYNFMPVFDWTRTQLDKKAADGSTSLIMDMAQLQRTDPLQNDIHLPGWDESYSRAELCALIKAYRTVTEKDLWENLAYFLARVIPVAESCGVVMAIHPDDPPYPIFGLPRIITCEKNLDRFLSLYDSPANGLTFCTGSLGSAAFNDVRAMAARYAAMGRIHFAHLRNVRLMDDGSFEECAHWSEAGSLDMVAILKALYENGFDGYIRPDHGRMIWGEQGKPGYGLFDRALGAAYINGIWETLGKTAP